MELAGGVAVAGGAEAALGTILLAAVSSMVGLAATGFVLISDSPFFFSLPSDIRSIKAGFAGVGEGAAGLSAVAGVVDETGALALVSDTAPPILGSLLGEETSLVSTFVALPSTFFSSTFSAVFSGTLSALVVEVVGEAVAGLSLVEDAVEDSGFFSLVADTLEDSTFCSLLDDSGFFSLAALVVEVVGVAVAADLSLVEDTVEDSGFFSVVEVLGTLEDSGFFSVDASGFFSLSETVSTFLSVDSGFFSVAEAVSTFLSVDSVLDASSTKTGFSGVFGTSFFSSVFTSVLGASVFEAESVLAGLSATFSVDDSGFLSLDAAVLSATFSVDADSGAFLSEETSSV